jgi:hypothetical protein
MGIRGLVVVAALVVLGAPAVAQAAPTVTITPVTGPHFVVHTASGMASDARTDERNPQFLIASDTAGPLSCTFDNGTPVPCTAIPAACAMAACATYSPTVTGDGTAEIHDLRVALLDGDGNELASSSYEFTFDLTAPDTTIAPEADLGPNPFRPVFNPSVIDDDHALAIYPGVDGMQCSLVPAGQPPHWVSCPLSGTQATFAPKLPRRRADYTFSARAFDDLGRIDPTPVSGLYDPIPCAVSVARTSARALSHSPYLTVTLHCTAISHTSVGVYTRQAYGLRPLSLSRAMGFAAISSKDLNLHLRGGHATVRLRLNAGSGYATYFRHYRTVSFFVVAGDVEPAPSNSAATVTVKR